MNNSTISLGLPPFLALTAYAPIEYLSSHGYDLNIDTNLLENTRLKLKILEDSYGKSKKVLLNVDYLQNEIFKAPVKLNFFKKHNLFGNLGIYANSAGQVLYNTQYAYYIFQRNNLMRHSLKTLQAEYLNNPEQFLISSQKVFEFASNCVKIIQLVYNGLNENKDLKNNIPSINTSFNLYEHQLYYEDLNTNCLFKHNMEQKPPWLFLLHILSTINFAIYGIGVYQQQHNNISLWIKIKYITYFYAHKKLISLEEHLKQNKLMTEDFKSLFNNCNLTDTKFISTNFRNVLMHSSFTDKNGTFLINKEYFDINKPFFGLIESCFNGISYVEFESELDSRLTNISKILHEWLNNIANFNFKLFN